MMATAVPLAWSGHGPTFKLDVMSFTLAILLHVPLYFMRFDAHKKSFDHVTNRLVAIDLIDPTILAPAPPPPVVKESSLLQRLKMLVKKEPPPPPPLKKVEPKVPEKLDTGPKEIKIEAKLKLPEPVQSKLEDKKGFKPTADAKLIEEKQISLKAMGAGIAPLSERKLGTIDNKDLKTDRGNFKVAQGETLRSIGGSGPGLADPAAPTIAIRTGTKASVEKFSAPQKADKGKLGSVGVSGLGEEKKIGLRDYVIARDAAPSQIDLSKKGSTLAGVPGGVEGGVEGGVVGGKRNAGRFQGGQIGGVGTKDASGVESVGTIKPIVPVAKPKPKRSMFVITGPLKDRKIVQQDLPDYPDWALSQGIEASVILEFVVEPNGSVKDSIVVRRTSGYPQLDQLAIKSLRRWKFASLPMDEIQDEVGQITFNFALS